MAVLQSRSCGAPQGSPLPKFSTIVEKIVESPRILRPATVGYVKISLFCTQIHAITSFFAVYHGAWPLQRSSKASRVAHTTVALRPARAACLARSKGPVTRKFAFLGRRDRHRARPRRDARGEHPGTSRPTRNAVRRDGSAAKHVKFFRSGF